jgi:phenylalanyl-tRNA synthetase beta chain
MPTVTFNRKEVEKLIGKKLSLEELKDRISMLGTDLEEITDDEIVVEIFPNRPDMLSEQGFARALSSFIGVKTGLKEYNVKEGNKDYKVMVDNSVEKVRPFTVCAIVKNLNLDKEKLKDIIQIQEKLHVTFGRNRKKLAIGIYPLEHIKLPIKYLAKKPEEIRFRPLESDKEMTALQILSKHPTGREYGHLLEGKKLFPIFMDSNNEILSMPPIINSHKTGRITEKTKEVFIECSGFDYENLEKCLNIIVSSLSEMGCDIFSMKIERKGKNKKTPNMASSQMNLDLAYVNKMLGLELDNEDIRDLLSRMGIDYKNKKVHIPCYRADILHQADIVEDIAIAYGYENFKAEIPNVATIAEEDSFENFKNSIAEILIGIGLIETVSYNLTNPEINNKKMKTKNEFVMLENSLNKDYSCLRTWLLPSLMKILSENTDKEYPQEIFEIGTVFNIDKEEETGIKEEDGLCVVLCGKNVDFTKIRQISDALMAALDVDFEVNEATHPTFIDGRCAVLKDTKNRDIAILGEINPEVITNFSVEMPVVAFEINLDKLYSGFQKS